MNEAINKALRIYDLACRSGPVNAQVFWLKLLELVQGECDQFKDEKEDD
jgi:hypothetical protein